MINLTVLYPYSAEKKFDVNYWSTTHKQLVLKIPGVKEVYTESGLSGLDPSTPPLFFAIAHITFETLEDLNAGLNTMEAQAAVEDNKMFTDVAGLFQIGKISE